MGVQALEHVTIRCAQLGRTRDFYVELMGLTEGERPRIPLPRPLALSGRGAGDPSGRGVRQRRRLGRALGHSRRRKRAPAPSTMSPSGAMISRRCAPRLQEAGVTFKERVVPGGRLSQLFVPDPEGVLVEINFRN